MFTKFVKYIFIIKLKPTRNHIPPLIFEVIPMFKKTILLRINLFIKYLISL